MDAPIVFYLDFASPYAWFALDNAQRIADENGRRLEWRPILVWAIFKAQGIAPPMEVPARNRYFVTDMARSADYLQVPYHHPKVLPVSAHRAARLFHWLEQENEPLARQFGRAVFAAFFVENENITDPSNLAAIAARSGIGEHEAIQAMDGEIGRSRLSATMEEAIKDGVIGSPFFILDGEPFFGADRLRQMEWRLNQKVPGLMSGETDG